MILLKLFVPLVPGHGTLADARHRKLIGGKIDHATPIWSNQLLSTRLHPLAGEEAEDRKMGAERLSQYSQCKRDGKRKSRVRALPASSADTLPR